MDAKINKSKNSKKNTTVGSHIVNICILGAFGLFLCNMAVAEIQQRTACLLPKPITDNPVVTPPKPVVISPVTPAIPVQPTSASSDNTQRHTVVNAIAKTHQNNIPATAQNGAHDDVPRMSSSAGESDHTAQNHGMGDLVGQHQENQDKVQACQHDIQLSTGTTSTIDVHGDNLIHVGVGDRGEDNRSTQPTGAGHDEHEHTSMTVHDITKTLNDLVNSDVVEAKALSQVDGQTILHAPEQTPETAPITPTATTNSTALTNTTSVQPEIISETQQPSPVTTSVQSTPDVPTPTVTEKPLTITPVNDPVPSVSSTSSTPPSTTSLPVSNLVQTEVSAPTPTVETITHPIQPTILDSSSRTTTVTDNQTISLNTTTLNTTNNTLSTNNSITPSVETETFVSSTPDTGLLTSSQSALITVGQVISKTGTVAEVDQDGVSHPLEVGNNVHLGGQFAFAGSTGSLVIRSFTGEIIHIGQ